MLDHYWTKAENQKQPRSITGPGHSEGFHQGGRQMKLELGTNGMFETSDKKTDKGSDIPVTLLRRDSN